MALSNSQEWGPNMNFHTTHCHSLSPTITYYNLWSPTSLELPHSWNADWLLSLIATQSWDCGEVSMWESGCQCWVTWWGEKGELCWWDQYYDIPQKVFPQSHDKVTWLASTATFNTQGHSAPWAHRLKNVDTTQWSLHSIPRGSPSRFLTKKKKH